MFSFFLLVTTVSGFFQSSSFIRHSTICARSVVENSELDVSAIFDDVDVTELGPAPEEVLDDIILGLERQLRIEKGDDGPVKKRSFVDSRKAARADIFSTIELTRKAEGDTAPTDVTANYFAEVSGFVETDDEYEDETQNLSIN
mmetsp:Transcript_625/g.800  ORF Transcript_625/g.800 Transcript_625/m.800 type:complete len:144 (-) Transcript_625:210-641(-)|eukprot:CAMPEP_0197299950 /NCGR_PEP_ID=MMETSP0890-20130614/47199_1 /TAXON_ID=44058 ORGANISM="Aureoumbra lagunensis, Strain CCMP1510" /NCGR_SAMPLE_ID=MMETSP0890 /ASSEMBLY_ACC=CAM_ASM_000533 /LENGTH=143 /DNA_ID=CAMNT_0042778523 /DNA_START=12 /DNA_END=443 /DNA_ORIENTATION=+